jgi:hypothetical protein
VAEKATVRNARKRHRCDEQRNGCSGLIRPGERYWEHMIYPGHDIVTVDKPTRLRQCGACAVSAGRPIDGDS